MTVYEPTKSRLLRLLRVPPEPTDPLGADGSLLVFRAAPGYLRYRWLLFLLRQAIALGGAAVALGATVGLFAFGPPIPPPGETILVLVDCAVVTVVVVQFFLGAFTVRLDYEMRWYKATDRALRIREGVWIVREMTMTFANVQNLSIEQGPLQRYFGIADLKVQSAGGGGSGSDGKRGHGVDLHTAYFRGVDNAEQVRDLVYARLQKAKDAGLGDPDEARATAGDDFTSLLRELRDEAAALRRASAD